VVQAFAPDFHASASGTMWSMSMDEEDPTQVASYTLYQLPAVGWQLLLTLTPDCGDRSNDRTSHRSGLRG
jgi:hypothetical protein